MSVDNYKAMNVKSATAELWSALVKAQASIRTVGKDGHNTQRDYAYTSSDAMVSAGRRALTEAGLALITTWEAKEPGARQGDIGNQFVAAKVWIFWVLAHEGGGVVTGRATMDAIGGRARPDDKAVAAAVTYGLGFVLRGLLLIDRNEDTESVDRRPEPEPDPWAELDQRTAALAQRLKMPVGHAQELVGKTAALGRKATERDIPALLAAVSRLEREPPKPAGKPQAEPEPEDDGPPSLAEEFKRACVALTERRRASYQDAEGKPPSKTALTEIKRSVMALAREAAGLKQWKDPTDEHLKAAIVALRDGKVSERRRWQLACKAYQERRGADFQKAEGEKPTDDDWAMFLADALDLSAVAVGLEKRQWPAQPTEAQYRAAARAIWAELESE